MKEIYKVQARNRRMWIEIIYDFETKSEATNWAAKNYFKDPEGRNWRVRQSKESTYD